MARANPPRKNPKAPASRATRSPKHLGVFNNLPAGSPEHTKKEANDGGALLRAHPQPRNRVGKRDRHVIRIQGERTSSRCRCAEGQPLLWILREYLKNARYAF